MSRDSPRRPSSTVPGGHHDRDQIFRSDFQTVVDGLTDLSYKVTSTASAWINPTSSLVKDIAPHLKRPSFQKRLLSSTSPHELLRNNLSPSEISYRQITYLSDDLLRDIPDTPPLQSGENSQAFTLFQGFEASLPQPSARQLKSRASQTTRNHHHHSHNHRRSGSTSGSRRKAGIATPESCRLERERDIQSSALDTLRIRKALASTEIKEVDTKLAQLKSMRSELMSRLEGLEADEALAVQELEFIEVRLAQAVEDEERLATSSLGGSTAVLDEEASDRFDLSEDTAPTTNNNSPFMSEATFVSRSSGSRQTSYGSPRTAGSKSHRKSSRRRSTPLLQQHFEPGQLMKSFAAHAETITAMDFDYPFGTLVTASLDDTTRVWNLATGKCTTMLEGHAASVRCLQLDDGIVVTGSADAKLKVWDLTSDARAHASTLSNLINKSRANGGDITDSESEVNESPSRRASSSRQSVDLGVPDHCLHTLDAHIGEVTALHFQSNVLVSGSADKTIRHWDLSQGRLLQTLDILSHASLPTPRARGHHSRIGSGMSDSSMSMSMTRSLSASSFRPTGSYFDLPPDTPSSIDQALFSPPRPSWQQQRQPSFLGTGEGAAGGHLPPYVGALQCFEQGLAAGTADGMVRFWDLRTGGVARELFGHTGPVTSVQFDALHLVSGSLDRSVRIWDLRTGAIADAFAYEQPIQHLHFDQRKIVTAAGEPFVRVYDRIESRHWGCGEDDDVGQYADHSAPRRANVVRVRQRENVCIGGRDDGTVSVWAV
ncbi:Mitochondrial fission protein [Savitreella phatthalungensis]